MTCLESYTSKQHIEINQGINNTEWLERNDSGIVVIWVE